MFQYTLHVPSPSLEAKMDGVVIRRGKRGYKLLSYLLLSSNILKVNSDTLSELLANEKIRLPKNSTRKTKILALMAAPSVLEDVPQATRQAIEKKLEEEEASRSKKKNNEEIEAEEMDEERES